MPTEDDERLFKLMPQLWTNFVINGLFSSIFIKLNFKSFFFSRNPISSHNNDSIPSWPAATEYPFDYMVIGNENGRYENVRLFRVDKGLFEDRANFWMKLREDHQLSRWNGSEKLKAPIIMLLTLFALLFTM